MSEAITYAESDRAKRTLLADQVPLEKPFTIRISPGRICNLQCEFCYHSVPEDRRRLQRLSGSRMMDYQLFRKIIDDIRDSFGKIRKISIVGRGEPLLHPRIADMVAYAAKQEVAGQIDILTNAINLSAELSERLIDSGLTSLRISVNGLSREDYLRRCGVNMDFEQFVRQIRYFYTHRKSVSLYVKIINYMVDSPEQREAFYRIFKPICDVINVENLYQTEADIDYKALTKEPEKLTYSLNSTECVQTDLCSSPFYILQIDENGLVQPCCAKVFYEKESAMGDVRDSSLKEIWFKRSYPFQRRILDGICDIPFCRGCTVRLAQTYPEDVLDSAAERLKAVYDERLKTVAGEALGEVNNLFGRC